MMRDSIWFCFFLLASVCLLMCAGCSQGVIRIDQPPSSRGLSTHMFGLDWPVPLDVYPGHFVGETVGFSVMVYGNDDDPNESSGLAIKVEVDPGDGSGWLDYTQGYLDTMMQDPLRIPDGTHMYGLPGSYPVRTRVTYWDGEVLNYSNSAPITTQPAPDAGE